MSKPYMVFDVESNGLQGEGFAVGWVVVQDAEEVAHGLAVGHMTVNTPKDAWVVQNVLPALPYPNCVDPHQVRTVFTSAWTEWMDKGAWLAADVPWPVEARFLLQCNLGKAGPYPLIDIASVRLAVGLDPLGEESRLPLELPQHNPLADARQSARLLIEALALRTEAQR